MRVPATSVLTAGIGVAAAGAGFAATHQATRQVRINDDTIGTRVAIDTPDAEYVRSRKRQMNTATTTMIVGGAILGGLAIAGFTPGLATKLPRPLASALSHVPQPVRMGVQLGTAGLGFGAVTGAVAGHTLYADTIKVPKA